MALPPMFQSNGGDRHADCMNVVRICMATRECQVFHTHRYAGLRRGALLHEEPPTPSVHHAPAHRARAVQDALPARERRIGIGNLKADALAKQALLLHPQPSVHERTE
eukprot:881180-Pyramimonas_sp.AAC.1